LGPTTGGPLRAIWRRGGGGRIERRRQPVYREVARLTGIIKLWVREGHSEDIVFTGARVAFRYAQRNAAFIKAPPKGGQNHSMVK